LPYGNGANHNRHVEFVRCVLVAQGTSAFNAYQESRAPKLFPIILSIFFPFVGHLVDTVTMRDQGFARSNRQIAGERKKFFVGLLSIVLFLFASNAIAREPVYDIDIPAQNAADALERLARQTGAIMLFPYELTSTKQANTVVGRYTLPSALKQLLNDTGLSGDLSEKRVVSITQIHAAERTEEEEPMNVKKHGVLAAIAVSLFGTDATAQDTSGEREYALDEIIVTSQIREENFQDVPVTGTIFDISTLEKNRLFEVDDIARFTPGFAASYFSYSSPNFSVRGAMNTFTAAGASKPVGVFIDDVYVPRNSAAAFELFDIQQISVLRGPQGTLFGRNVTGGAIQIKTTEPSLEESQFKFKLGTGNYDLYEVSALLSGPISDNVAGKISVGHKKRDGYSFDRFGGFDLEDLDTTNIRGTLLFAPRDNLEIRWAMDYSKDENNGRAYSFVSNNAGDDFFGNDGDNRTAELRVPQSFERDIFGTSVHVDWELDAGTLQSITAYRSSDARDLFSLGAADVTLPTVSTQFVKDEIDEPKAISQEIRFISNIGERFDFVTGLFFYDESTDKFLGDRLLGAGGNALFVNRDFTVTADTQSIAAYLSGTFHLAESFDLSLGGRYTSEDKDVTVNMVDNNNPGNSFSSAPGNSFSEFTPRITLTYFPTEDLTFFASRTEGFTAGGFNTEVNNQGSVERGFDPETMVAYELGAKTVWNDGRFLLNLTLFDQEYENKLEGVLLQGFVFTIFNAAKASMTGAELEFVWGVTDNLTASGTYSSLDAEYDVFVADGATGPIDFSGNKLQTAPESSYSIALDYVSDVGSGELSGGLSYTWQDEYFTGANNIPAFLIDDYALFNARVGYAWGNGRWAVNLWGKNLADEDFVRIRGTSGAIAEFFGPPRTYGLNLTYLSE
jgi:iron complex outermembrane receptor protein